MLVVSSSVSFRQASNKKYPPTKIRPSLKDRNGFSRSKANISIGFPLQRELNQTSSKRKTQRKLPTTVKAVASSICSLLILDLQGIIFG
jgi:hypothetical protein